MPALFSQIRAKVSSSASGDGARGPSPVYTTGLLLMLEALRPMLQTTDSLTVAARFTLLAAWRPIATGGPVTTAVRCPGK